jgi:cation transport protein ChaC
MIVKKPNTERGFWVFGYGSLMWSGWEACFQGTKHERVTLRNYHRDFNKSSTKNWGTRKRPCPTLGLVKQKGTECIGSAFHFEDKWKRATLAYLRGREGSSFKLIKRKVELVDGHIIEAFTPINDPKSSTYVGQRSTNERAQMAQAAEGTHGKCFDYVRDINKRLTSLEIADEPVKQMWAAVKQVHSSK